MKIFAVLVLTAVIAYASADDAAPTDYVGDLQDAGSADVVRIGAYVDCDMPAGAAGAETQHGIPTCKLGKDIGNPLCMAKCISRKNKGGYCEGKKCTCTN